MTMVKTTRIAPDSTMVKIGATYAFRWDTTVVELVEPAFDNLRPMYQSREAIALVAHMFTTSSRGHPSEPNLLRAGEYMPASGFVRRMTAAYAHPCRMEYTAIRSEIA